MYLSIVIPAYNEADNIEKTIEKTILNVSLNQQITDFEIIFCDDHSSDKTLEVIKKVNHEKVSALRLSKRSGSHTAIRAGLLRVKGDAVLCISADGQEDTGVLGKMLDQLNAGHQIVWGVRNQRKEPFLAKLLSSVFYYMLNKFVPNENNVDLANADFYLLSRNVVDSINECKERNTSLFGLISWMGFSQEQIVYERIERFSGQSKWNFKSKIKLTVDWIISFSGIPLKLITLLGVLFSSIGFLYSIYIIVLSINGLTTPGWAETVILILITGGIQMLMIGIIGEYLWRTLDESRKRPLFFIEEEVKKNKI